MTIVEQGINYPRALGWRNIPWISVREAPIGNLAMALIRGEAPVHLAQKFLGQVLPPRGTGLITGTARRGLERGMGRRLTEIERARRHAMIFGQLEKRPILEAVKERVRQLRGQTEKNIPPPYVRPAEWPLLRLIGGLPSAVADIRPTGPQRTVHPKKTRASIHVMI